MFTAIFAVLQVASPHAQRALSIVLRCLPVLLLAALCVWIVRTCEARGYARAEAHYLAVIAERDALDAEAALLSSEIARAKERAAAENLAAVSLIWKKEKERVESQLSDVIAGLRDDARRLRGALRPANCAGPDHAAAAPGSPAPYAVLSRNDVEFLFRESARADGVVAELNRCESSLDAIYSALNERPANGEP